MKITDRTRKNIIQIFKSESIKWQGKLNDVDFLSRIYDLDSMPSTDSRYKTATADISTHRVSFPEDWSENWVFGDARFNLHACPDEEFLRFLCETLDPAVRPEADTNLLLPEFNRELGEDGVQILKVKTKFGNIRYQAKGITPSTIDALREVREATSKLNWGYADREIIRITNSMEEDPDLAIGNAKELVETVSKTILNERGEAPKGNEDLPKLVQKTLLTLGIVGSPQEEKKTKETTKKILGALATLVQSIGELRNLHGTGHGKDARTAASDPRYASLTVNAAATITLFLVQAHTAKTPVTPNGRIDRNSELSLASP